MNYKKRYQIKRELGRNAGRRTLLAYDQKIQKWVIIKVLKFNENFDWTTFKLFEREAETLKSLDHPAIPDYQNYFEINGDNYQGFAFVQSYIDSPSLETRLNRGEKFNETEVKQIAYGLLDVLQYLHSQYPPVIHRDLKPSNILLGDGSGNDVGQVYLVDFGAVKTLATPKTETYTVVGTYGYMPPEQFRGETQPASDLYSLGATLIYLITGQPPADLPQEDLRIKFESKANISSHFCHWLQRLTEPTLEQRVQTTKQAYSALKEVQKPSRTRVELMKTSDILQISFSLSSKKAKATAIMILFLNMMAICSIISGLIVIDLSFSLGNQFWILGIVLVIYGLVVFGLIKLGNLWKKLIALWKSGQLFRHINLQIDSEQIQLNYDILGLKLQRPKPSSRHSITKIIRFKNYRKKYQELAVWAGVRKYQLTNNLLTVNELDWLAQELSDWLGLSIVNIKD